MMPPMEKPAMVATMVVRGEMSTALPRMTGSSTLLAKVR